MSSSLSEWHFELVVPCPGAVPLSLVMVLPWGSSWHHTGSGLGDASIGWVSGPDALSPWHGGYHGCI